MFGIHFTSLQDSRRWTPIGRRPVHLASSVFKPPAVFLSSLAPPSPTAMLSAPRRTRHKSLRGQRSSRKPTKPPPPPLSKRDHITIGSLQLPRLYKKHSLLNSRCTSSNYGAVNIILGKLLKERGRMLRDTNEFRFKF